MGRRLDPVLFRRIPECFTDYWPTASTFMRHGLIDQFQIFVHPVVLGQCRPLFESPDVRMNLSLEGTRTFGNGVVSLRYSNDRP